LLEIAASLKQASKEYKIGETVITALQPTSFDLMKHQLTLVIGPSGSGKTTLLSLIGCVIFSTNGEVYVNDVLVNGLGQKELAKIRLTNIGFIFQSFNLVAPLTSIENVMMPLILMGVAKKEGQEKAEAALVKLNMQNRMNNLPKTLSNGEQQRVAIARAMVADPGILLCDEPTASLDVKSGATVMEELKNLAEAGKAVAVVTHDLRLKQFADRIVYVVDGKVSETPAADEVFK
jgi:putative ABC transport system ATP-binding protein